MRKMRVVGAGVIVAGTLFLGVLGLIVASLWNALLPALFGFPAITLWQALGLLVLSRILFGSFGGMGHRMRRARFARGWGGLTPEERQRFRQAMGAGCPKFEERPPV